LLDNIGNKKTFLLAISLVLLGSASFAVMPKYEVGLVSLFVIGIGVTALQMVSNLLVKKIDEDPNKYSRNLTLAQIFCGIGGLGGGFVLNFIDTSRALIIYAFGCLASLLVAALVPSAQMSAIAFISVGFFTSIMFPCIFSLTVNSFDKRQEGTVAGIICTAIVGGAVVSPFIGFISDITKSLSFGLILASVISFLYIAFVGHYTLRKTSVFYR